MAHRRIRLALLGVLVPGTVVAWQAVETYPVKIETYQADKKEDSEAIARLDRAIGNASRVLDAFYESDDFDQYASWYASHEPDQKGTRLRIEEACADAEKVVFLPPFAGQVNEECAQLLDVKEADFRTLAFGPILIEFVRRCQTGQENPPRLDNPYTEEQWALFTEEIDRALDSECVDGRSTSGVETLI